MLLDIKLTEDLIAASQAVSLASCLCEFLLLYLSSQDLHLHRKFHKSYPTLCWPLPDLGHPFCCLVDAAIKQKICVGRKEREWRKGKKERKTSAGFALWAVANEPSPSVGMAEYIQWSDVKSMLQSKSQTWGQAGWPSSEPQATGEADKMYLVSPDLQANIWCPFLLIHAM